jgi:aquaporin Z
MINWRALVAEFIGTFTLVFVGSAAVWFAKTTPGYTAGPLVPAFAHGFVVVSAVYALGKVSGSHINPAVTVAMALTNNIDWLRAALYIVVQIAAGLVAAFALNAILSVPGNPTQAVINFGAFGYNVNATTSIGALFTELILTFFLMFAVMMAAVYGKAGDFAGIAIGLTLAANIVAGGSISESSMNPARSIGPAIIAGDLGNIWIYIIGPVLGASLAAVLASAVFNPSASERTPPKKNTGRR